jgi:hypothetical protein
VFSDALYSSEYILIQSAGIKHVERYALRFCTGFDLIKQSKTLGSSPSKRLVRREN